MLRTLAVDLRGHGDSPQFSDEQLGDAPAVLLADVPDPDFVRHQEQFLDSMVDPAGEIARMPIESTWSNAARSYERCSTRRATSEIRPDNPRGAASETALGIRRRSLGSSTHVGLVQPAHRGAAPIGQRSPGCESSRLVRNDAPVRRLQCRSRPRRTARRRRPGLRATAEAFPVARGLTVAAVRGAMARDTQQTVAMGEWPDPPRTYAPLFTLERSRLLEVLENLGVTDWSRPTPCPGWSVLGLGSHLVGDDLSFLAWQRDDHRGTPAPSGLDEHSFIAWLDDLQIEWVHAARRLSPKLVVELLAWLDDQVAATVANQNPSVVTANVPWASTTPVPVWLNHARELSERWIHRQQILQSLDLPADDRADLAEPVLDGLRWAYPFRLASLRRPAGTRVVITVEGAEFELHWNLICDGEVWQFSPSVDEPIAAELQMTMDQAWRRLTNNLDVDQHHGLVTSGDSQLIGTLLQTRAIIGAPK